MSSFPKAPLDNRIVGTEMEYTVGSPWAKPDSESTDTKPEAKPADLKRLTTELPFNLRQLSYFVENGARYYIDHNSAVEYATPECTSAKSAVAAELAGELIVTAAVAEHLPEMRVYKNLIGPTGHTAGHHENYGISSHVDRDRYNNLLLGHLVSRLVFNGAGNLWVIERTGETIYTIGQKTSSIEDAINGHTTQRKPIINTREENHGSDKLPRLHITSGDANISQWAMWYTLVSTSAVLSLIERKVDISHLIPINPVRAIHRVSTDPTLTYQIETADGKHRTALDIQQELIALIDQHVLGDTDNPEFSELVEQGYQACADARTDINLLGDRVDWVVKKMLIEARRAQRPLTVANLPAAIADQAIGMRYGEIMDGFGVKLRESGALRQLVDKGFVHAYIKNPPNNTRAHPRGRFVRTSTRTGAKNHTVQWDRWGRDNGTAVTHRNPYDPAPKAHKPQRVHAVT